MEGEILVRMNDSAVSEARSLISIAPDHGFKPDLMKRESLASIQHPLRSGCSKHNGDFLPTEILANLTSQFDKVEDLGPQGNGRLKKSKTFPKVFPKRPPDNLWNHAKTRERFKHLTEQPPCTCGAGRDISFLYDAVGDKKNTQESQQRQSTEKGKRKKEVTMSPILVMSKERIDPLESERGAPQAVEKVAKDGSLIPETLLPSEFHIVKSPGVIGLEIHEGKFTTTMDDHERHLTLFPSMKPSGRQEAVLLRKTMEDLLLRAGVEDFKRDEDQPTQIHALLDLVKQEQNIYNVVFNEVIRQVSIECVERGELLSDLRKRYANILDKVPRHVKSLHEEVLAQRALDRRLTEELTRFKTSITLLTRELDVVQEHDREVTRQAAETQNELNAALKESEKNANLLAEYHELYELQRKRLEFQISKLIEERDLWAGASYTLSLKVAQKHNLKTAKRLHLHEKAWYKLSGHFAILLSDVDSLHLQELTKHVQNWQEVAEKFYIKLIASEKETFRKLNHVKKQVDYWGRQFLRVVTPDEGTVHPPEKSTVAKLYEDMKRWEEVFNSEIERFSGDILLSSEDDLVRMNRMVDNWSEIALKIFARHTIGQNSKRPDHEAMLMLNQQVDQLHKDFRLRITGENGLAKGFIHFINVLDSLGNKLSGFSHGSESLLDPEWVRLADFLQNEWADLLAELIELVSPSKEDNNSMASPENEASFDHVDLQALSESAQKWLTETSKSVENGDASLLDHVSNSHSNMVRWMVTVLLRLAPDLEADLFDNGDLNIGIGAGIISESTTEEIQQRAVLQFRVLRKLSNDLYNCCIGIVNDDVQRKQDVGQEIAEVEMRDLKGLKSECDGWIKTAILLVEEFSSEIIQEAEIEDEIVNESIKINTEDSSSGKAFEKRPSLEVEKSDIRQNEISRNEEDEAKKSEEQGRKQESIAKEDEAENSEEQDRKQDSIAKATKIIKETEGSAQPIEIESHENLAESKSSQPAKTEFENDVIQMHVIGEDENVKVKVLDVAAISNQITSDQERGPSPEKSSSLEALGTIEILQKQLVETEERAQTLEERAIIAETQLKEALERVRALERTARRASLGTENEQRPTSGLTSIQDYKNDVQSVPTTSRTTSRVTSRATSRGTPTTPNRGR